MMDGKQWHCEYISSYAPWMDFFFNQKHTLEKCMVMETKYVQIVVDSLKEKFHKLSIFLCIEVLQSQ